MGVWVSNILNSPLLLVVVVIVFLAVACLLGVVAYFLGKVLKGSPWRKLVPQFVMLMAFVVLVAPLFIFKSRQNDNAFRIERIVRYIQQPIDPTIFIWPNKLSLITGAGHEPVATFTIPFGEASCQSQDVAGHWEGTYPGPEAVRFIRKLAQGLELCAESKRPTKVRVRGFASSSNVEGYEHCDGAKDSNMANLKIAHRREEAVAELLRTAANKKSGKLMVISDGWSDFEEMERERQFNDRLLNGNYATLRGVLTRRVEINLINPANCGSPN